MVCRVILLLLLSNLVLAQEFYPAPLQAIGNTGIAAESIYSIASNAAGIAFLDKHGVALAYQPHYFTSDLRNQALYFIYSLTDKSSLGFGIHNYGINGTSSFLNAKLAFAKAFGNSLALSVEGNYNQFYINQYNTDHQFSLNLGVQYKVKDQAKIGFFVQNVSFSKYEDYIDQYITSSVGFGVNYLVSSEFSLLADAVYDYYGEMSYRGGLTYTIDHKFVFRTGVSTGAYQFHTGLGMIHKKFKFDISTSFHRRLSFAPQLALSYDF